MSQLTPDKLPLRDELKGQSAYGAPQLTVKNQLNTNENPYPPSQGLIEELGDVVVQRAQELNRYPDRDALGVRGALADYVSRQTGVDVSVENLWAANGSNEVLQQLLLAFGGPGRTAMGFTPSYSMHQLLAVGTFTEFIAIDRDPAADFSINMDSTLDAIARYAPDVIFITTPNNPTGGSTSLEDIEKILKVAPGIVIIDEAYAEFSDAPSATTLLEAYPDRLVVSRTMSKAFDFAGGRLGYFVADSAFVQAVQLIRLPYHLSTLSQAAAEVALRHSDETLDTVAWLVSERERVQAELERLGYSVVPSDSNFIFFGGIDDAPGLWQKFLDHDVLIRDVGVPGYLRVTIGTPEENDDFLTAAQELAPVR